MGHAHGPGHSHHGHSHGDARQADSRRLAWVMGLVVLYMGAEVVGGWLTGSLALLADAGHMLSDAAALALALFALWIARRPATMQRSFGYHRMEILAALTNGAALVAISLLIGFEAVERLRSPTEVAAPGMMAVAAGGLLVNLVGLAVLHGGREASLNLRGAWLHVAVDALGSVQVLAAGALIWAFGWQWADPVASVAIAVLVVWSAWSLLRETVGVLMQWAPRHIDVEEVHGAIQAVEGVEDVHDLHVWTVTSGLDTLSAHVVARERPAAGLLHEIRDTLHRRFGIAHVTIQVEPEGHEDCGAC
ncbi:MAG TPA: cation diffusion facilitator family transporter [Thermoanaerobaculia bacterium]|nr:cation diffusion facilitator family transporter [Thermoanaerobaculia bacterium]